jgi:FkbM family methyltransferase
VLISADRLQTYWNLHPEVLVHIGAHEAEELDDYRRLGWGSTRTIWVEALPGKADHVRSRITDLPQHSVINAVLWDEADQPVEFQETTNGQSSSALQLKDHASVYSEITVKKVWKFTTARASSVIPFAELGRIGLVNIDIQGAELRALKGFGSELDRVDAIYSEVNLRELYRGAALLGELDAWLQQQGFVRVDLELLPAVGWGDGLWLRRELVPPRPALRRAARRLVDIPRRAKFAIGTRWRRNAAPRR